MYTAGERFLLAFHAQLPGVTATAFGGVPVRYRGQELASSYEVLAQAVPFFDGPATVLDLGCGNGHLLAMLARARPMLGLIGVDFSVAELGAARCATASFVGARAQQLPLREASCDAVLSHMALMLMDDVGQVLREVARVLKPGGVVAAVVGGGIPPDSPAFAAYVELLRRHLATLPEVPPRIGNKAFYSEESVRSLFAEQFIDLAVEPVLLQELLAPAEAWTSFERMYDLHHLPMPSRRELRDEYLEAVRPLVGADGRLSFPRQLRFIRARRGSGSP